VVSGLPHLISDPDDPGYDPYYDNPFCTGCNFNLLIDIYLLNKFTQASSGTPRQTGVCGTLVSGTASTPATASAGIALLALPGLFILIKRRTRDPGVSS
jgi:LPXTG-motif cell wall-anchored protein